MDPATGVMLNADMEMYKLAGASDIPEIIVKCYEPTDQKARGGDRRGRAADDLDRRRDRQRRDQRHRRPGRGNGRCPRGTCSMPWPRSLKRMGRRDR